MHTNNWREELDFIDVNEPYKLISFIEDQIKLAREEWRQEKYLKLRQWETTMIVIEKEYDEALAIAEKRWSEKMKEGIMDVITSINDKMEDYTDAEYRANLLSECKLYISSL